MPPPIVKRCNRHDPNPTLDMIKAPLRRLWDRDIPDTEILHRLRARHIPPGYGLGYEDSFIVKSCDFCFISIRKLRKMREELGLFSVRKQVHTVESITSAMTVLRQQFPLAGRRELRKLLCWEHGIRVQRYLIDEWMQLYEPDLLRHRKSGKLRRKRFFAAGCHDLWCCDQHDKWKRFGLGLHVCLDPFTGQLIWLKIWWGNRNPRLIFGYYLEAVRRRGYTCLVGQGDTGSENWCFAKGHTFIRHALDPGLEGTIQFRFMRSKKNIAPEIFWSNFRTRFAPGFEDILDAPLRNQEIRYDPSHPLQYNVFKWIFIPWLQAELDEFANRFNTTKKRFQRCKILPQGGCPDDIEEYPEEYGVRNFKVMIDPNADCLREAEQLYAPPGHPTFDLVPEPFHVQAKAWYHNSGSPEINRTNVWNVYMRLLTHFEHHPELLLNLELSAQPEEEQEGVGNDFVPNSDPFLANLGLEIRDMTQLPDNPDGYEGGVGGGTGDDPAEDSDDYDEEAHPPFIEATLTDEEEGMDSLVAGVD